MKKFVLCGMAFAISFHIYIGSVEAQSVRRCSKVDMNLQGVARANITVDNTTGGIRVATANSQRCALLIENVGANPMLCTAIPTLPTATVGKLFQASSTPGSNNGGQLGITDGSTQEWRCFSTAGTTANVLEELP